MTRNSKINDMYKPPESNVDGNQFYINGVAIQNIMVSKYYESHKNDKPIFKFILVLILVCGICLKYIEYDVLAIAFFALIPALLISVFLFQYISKSEDYREKCEYCGNQMTLIEKYESIKITRPIFPEYLGFPILYYCDSCKLYWYVGNHIPDNFG